MSRRFGLLACAVLLAGCAGALQWNPPGAAPSPVRPAVSAAPAAEPLPRSYHVKVGDTLYSIAWRYGLDYHDLAAWNGIGSDYLIKPGQTLALSAPEQSAVRPAAVAPRPAPVPVAPAPLFTPPAGPVRWTWPARGRLTRLFHADDPLSKGVDIGGVEGEDVLAAAAGKVVYTGSGIIGYGQLIIIKNSEEFLSAYADNGEILVKEGDVVRAGERIASMGLGRDGRPLLHFEIRYNGKPVNPLSYLPSR